MSTTSCLIVLSSIPGPSSIQIDFDMVDGNKSQRRIE